MCTVRYLEAMYGLGDGVEGRGAASASASALALAQARSSMWMDWILYGGDFGPSFATANHRCVLISAHLARCWRVGRLPWQRRKMPSATHLVCF